MMKLFISIVMSLLLAMTAFATAEAQNSKITITVNGAEFQVKEAQNITISTDGVTVNGKQLTGDRPITVSIYGNVANLAVTGGNVTATQVTNLSVIEGTAEITETVQRVNGVNSQIRIETNKGSIMNQAIQDGSGNVQYNRF